METPVCLMENLTNSVEAYSRTSIEIAKLKVLQTTSDVAASLVARLSVVLAVSLFAFVFNVGIALWLGELLGKNYHGFFVVAAFYLLVAALLHFVLPAWMRKTVGGIIITEALN